MKRTANQFNRSQPCGGFLQISMGVPGGPTVIVLPMAATESMRQRIECVSCGCRYAVIGAAFFCPACGHNSVGEIFSRTLDAIRGSLNVLEIIRASIDDPDTANDTCRFVVENGLQNAVAAFQRYLGALYDRIGATRSPRRNAFQNLREGSDIWKFATGTEYSDYLDDQELSELGIYFQQRHLLAHRQGLVDQNYIDRSGDSTYGVGQRLVVSTESVRGCVDLVGKLGTALANTTDDRLPQAEDGAESLEA